MKRLFVFGAAVLWIASAAAQTDMPRNQSAQSTEVTYSKTVPMRYLLYTPAGHGQDKAKKWPLMVFLHGAGERGTNLADVAAHGPPKLVKAGKEFPFVLISPQCPPRETWQREAVMGLIDQAIEKYNIDPERVYLTGLSMGGFGTWSLAMAYPERFAAAAPICGGGSTIEVLLPNKAAALKSLPVWAFHGAKDTTVPLADSERMVEAFKKAGNNDVKLTVYPEATHDSWTETYNNPELFKWFLEKKRTQERQP